jgi:hypothetical protein
MNDSSDSDEGRSAGYVRTDEVASVLELMRELREIELALELATLELARAESLDFLGWSEKAYDSAIEYRGSDGGGSSGSGLSIGLNKPFRGGVLKTCTGITGCNLDELARTDLAWLSATSGGASRGSTGALGRRGGGVTVRVDSPSPESYATEPSKDGCIADGGGDGRIVFGSTGNFNRSN